MRERRGLRLRGIVNFLYLSRKISCHIFYSTDWDTTFLVDSIAN